MNSEGYAHIIDDVCRKSFEQSLHPTIDWRDNRLLRTDTPGSSSYDTVLPSVLGEPFSYFLEHTIHTAGRPLSVVDLGCGKEAHAIHQGRELFGTSVYWTGVNATISPTALCEGSVLIHDHEPLVREKLAIYAGNAPVTLLSGDIQHSPELLEGLGADIIVANKTWQYLGDPWGGIARMPLCMNESAVFIANDVAVAAVIPELTNAELASRFTAYCESVLQLYISENNLDIARRKYCGIVWNYSNGRSIPLRYSGEYMDITYRWTYSDLIDPTINPYVTVRSLTYDVDWERISNAGY